jgi:transposase
VVRRDPRQYRQPVSRWSLARLRASCPWLRLTTDPGLSQVLKRLKVHLKRGRAYVHSPDPAYDTKLAQIRTLIAAANTDPSRVVVFMDEFSYYRQPSVARAYAASGHEQMLARRSHRSNTKRTVLGALNVVTGQVTYVQRAYADVGGLRAFFRQLRAAYPQAQRIYVILDNWPMHVHPDVLSALEAQTATASMPRPRHWPTQPTRDLPQLNLPIQLVPLPTYASWCNPIEKLWRWLNQDLLHLHPYADEWQTLQAEVTTFLDQFDDGSEALLRYTGLLRD